MDSDKTLYEFGFINDEKRKELLVKNNEGITVLEYLIKTGYIKKATRSAIENLKEHLGKEKVSELLKYIYIIEEDNDYPEF